MCLGNCQLPYVLGLRWYGWHGEVLSWEALELLLAEEDAKLGIRLGRAFEWLVTGREFVLFTKP